MGSEIKTKPLLILLPGMDGTGELFASFIEAFSSDIEVLFIRYPSNCALGYEELTDHVKACLPQDQDYVLLGESFSGPIAITIASEQKSNLVGLVLCCTFVSSPYPYLRHVKKMMRWIPFAHIPTFFMNAFLLGKFGNASIRAAIKVAVRTVMPEVLNRRVQEILSVNRLSQLGKITVPCLYLKATHDRLIPSHALTAMSNVLPSIRVCTVTGPHCLLQAAPNEAATLVNAFLEELSHSER